MMPKICRDDLRYTDDVIATLQSNLPYATIAMLLNIPRHDVAYHVDEVYGMTHAGRVLDWKTASVKRSTQAVANRKRRAEHNHKYPTDPAWYAARTCAEIARELHCPYSTVNTHMRRYGLTYKRAQRPVRGTQYPIDPAWFAARSIRQIAHELGKRANAVHSYMVRRNIRWLGYKPCVGFPTDPTWFATRTAAQAAEELGCDPQQFRAHARYHGYTYLRVRKYQRKRTA